MELNTPLILLGSFLAVYFGVRFFRAYVLRRGVLDHPNERSSHTVPTPRGGGLVIAVVTIAAYVISYVVYGAAFEPAFVLAAIAVVIISWLDDVYGLSFLIRLAVHFAAAAAVVVLIGGFQSVMLPNGEIYILGIFGCVLAVIWIVWMTNAYNFMDGIDGIAGVQGVAAGVGWFAAAAYTGAFSTSILAGILAFGCLAFLLHNWQPARIFMGDAGSAFLGFAFGCLPLLYQKERASSNGTEVWLAVLFLWPFFFDSVLTFMRRLAAREKVWQAHRSHLYQRMVIAGWQHRSVSRIYFFIALCLSFAGYYALLSGRNVSTVTLAACAVTGVALFAVASMSERRSR